MLEFDLMGWKGGCIFLKTMIQKLIIVHSFLPSFDLALLKS